MIGISRSVSGSFTILPIMCLVALVFRVHHHGGVAEHGFRAGGGDHGQAPEPSESG